jgi:hypothetical protein
MATEDANSCASTVRRTLYLDSSLSKFNSTVRYLSNHTVLVLVLMSLDCGCGVDSCYALVDIRSFSTPNFNDLLVNYVLDSYHLPRYGSSFIKQIGILELNWIHIAPQLSSNNGQGSTGSVTSQGPKRQEHF